MARARVSNPGPTAKFYRNNKASREKHNRDNNTGGKHDHTKEYTRWHSERRRSLGIMGNGGKDVTKKGLESVKKNRGRGGAKRK